MSNSATRPNEKQILNNEEYIISDDDDDDEDDDDDIEEFDDLGDECLLEEVGSASNSMNGGNSQNVSVNNNSRGPYERAWTTDATRALIHIRGPLEGRFTEGRQKRTALWLHCTRQLQRLGHRYSAAKVQKKWHNILITYNKNLNKKYSTGYVHWEFFEDMFKYLQGKKADCEVMPLRLSAPPPLTARQQVQPPPTSTASSLPPPPPCPELIVDNKQHIQMLQVVNTANTNVGGVQYQNKNSNKLRISNVFQSEKKCDYDDDDDDDDDDDEDSIALADLKKPKKLDIKPTYLPPPPPMEYMNTNGGDYVVDQNSIESALEREHDALLIPDQASSEWWKDYFERKLQVEREKIQAQRDIHNDLMEFKKSSLAQQERIEKLKIDAINGLTTTLQKLNELRYKKS